jgi:hypothetical protein
MNAPKTLAKASWIADELIGIRMLEERLSKKLQSAPAVDNRALLAGIRDLNARVEMLDLALDQVSRSGRAA